MFPRLLFALLFLTVGYASAREFHVCPGGDDAAPGTFAEPFRSIAAAAAIAQAGDTITVREGVYRERIDPPRGGASDNQRITYRAAAGETVVIKGSEQVKDWSHLQHDTWMVRLPNSFFGDYNPYATEIAGDWFEPLGGEDRRYHTGSVYFEGHWLQEAPSKEAVLRPADDSPRWFGGVEDETTTLYAQFPQADPNEALVEINVREAVFYPRQPGIDYITVQGFILEQAAPNWAPPTAEQVGLIGTHWSKGWNIEDNTIRYSITTGLTLGKYGDAYDNQGESAEGYIGTIRRALENGWNRGTIGSHIVRNNHIHHCEQAGIVGSMGGAFSLIEGNTIHAINRRGMLGGHEMAGIKLHGPIDTILRHNHIYACGGSGGIWLDWMSQGTRVTGNLLHDNVQRDLFMEVNHGPFLVDHNILLSTEAIFDWSQGGAYAHNLIAGTIRRKDEPRRKTPYFQPHSTENMRIAGFDRQDERFFNNWLLGPADLAAYQGLDSVRSAGNVLQPDASVQIHRVGSQLELKLPPLPQAAGGDRPILTSRRLGRAAVPDASFVTPDGSPYRLDRDFFGRPHGSTPQAGPFAAESLQESVIIVPASLGAAQ